MASKRGFTLIEFIIVSIIVGSVAAVAIPNLIASVEQSKALTAQNNLMAISAGEQKYFEDNNNYCTTTTPFANCGDNLTDLNTNLHLGMMANDPFSYSCVVAGSYYSCSAGDGTDSLALTVSAAGGNAVGANVNCSNTGNNSSYCPSTVQ
jgi:prepilin-type N-terminal cleavage/methylation domain-containing protein